MDSGSGGAPCGTAWRAARRSTVGTPSQGYPLGQRVLHVRSLPQRADLDVACLVEDDQGQQLAAICPMPQDRHLVTGATRFGLLDSRAIPMGFFSVEGVGANNVVGFADVSGRAVAQLRRTNTFWQRVWSSAMDMTLESGERTLGHTRVRSPRQHDSAPLTNPSTTQRVRSWLPSVASGDTSIRASRSTTTHWSARVHQLVPCQS